MPYFPNTSPQGAELSAQSPSDSGDMPASLKLALEQAAARMVGEDPAQGPQVRSGRAMSQAGAVGSRVQSVPAFEAVVQRLLTDPTLAAHLADSDQPDDEDDDLGPPDFGPPPYEPMARMQWDVAHRVHNRLVNARRVKVAQRRQRAQAARSGNQSFLRALAQTDPLFNRTYALLQDYLRHQPPGVLRQVAPQLDQNPRKFLELYAFLRRFVGMCVQRAQSAGQAGAGRMDAASLENPGFLDENASAGSRQAELNALRARMKAQGAGPGDLERYLDLLGVADRMVS